MTCPSRFVQCWRRRLRKLGQSSTLNRTASYICNPRSMECDTSSMMASAEADRGRYGSRSTSKLLPGTMVIWSMVGMGKVFQVTHTSQISSVVQCHRCELRRVLEPSAYTYLTTSIHRGPITRTSLV